MDATRWINAAITVSKHHLSIMFVATAVAIGTSAHLAARSWYELEISRVAPVTRPQLRLGHTFFYARQIWTLRRSPAHRMARVPFGRFACPVAEAARLSRAGILISAG
jgi:hypothetical protein